MDECFACRNSVAHPSRPASEAIHEGDGWRVAHAFSTSLPGWLVLIPERHVSAVEELSADEAATMGTLIRSCSAALRRLTGCAKSYFMFFAEAEGFSHLHVHVVPRMDWFHPEYVGPKVFSLLGVEGDQALSLDQRTAFSLALRAALAEKG